MAADKTAGPMLVHNVYFSLNESTPAAREKLVASCRKYLTNHPGTVFFAVGTPSDLDRPVNDRDFDVGLHVVFQDRAAHDAYQVAERHQRFIAENKPTWKRVRVFDSDAGSAAP
jgi:stress responsive alpha/beta barrel protein